MRRRLGLGLVLVLLVLSAARLAFSDDEAIPMDVLMILARTAAGVPPSADDQKKLDEYALHHDDVVDGVSTAEVVAIVKASAASGKRPPSADCVKIEKWANGVASRKKKVVDDAKKIKEDVKKVESQPARPGGLTPPPPHAPNTDIHRGTLVFAFSDHGSLDSDDGGSTTHSDVDDDLSVEVPVRFDVKDVDGNLTIGWTFDPSPRVGIRGSDTQTTESLEQRTNFTKTFQAEATGAVMCPPEGSGAQATGAVAVLKGGKRPYLKSWIATNETVPLESHTRTTTPDGTKDESDTQRMPVALLAPATLDDTAAIEGPFLVPAEVPEAYRKMIVDQLSKNITPEVKAAAQGARCTFDAESFRKQWAAGRPFKATAKYHYTLIQTTKKGSVTEHVSKDVATRATFEFGGSEADLEILPGPAWGSSGADAKANADAYHDWVPRPYTDDAQAQKVFNVEKKDGALTLAFVVGFRTKEGQAPYEGEIQLRLTAVSNNNGMCCNFPKAAKAEKGLFFPTGMTGDGKKIQPDEDKLDISGEGQTATTKPGAKVSGITIVVAARDSGAYGLLEASCPERHLQGIWKLSQKADAPIPDDVNHNLIADRWERDAGVYDRSYQGTRDSEIEPHGASLGDGISLYDEYRGFVYEDPASKGHELTWRRLDPKKKKLFVYIDETYIFPCVEGTPTWQDIVRDGGKLYSSATGIDVHFLRTTETVLMPDDQHPPVVNFNSDADPAYAVRVAQPLTPLKGSNAVPAEWPRGETPALEDNKVSTDPSDVKAVHIGMQNINTRINYWKNFWFTDANLLAKKEDHPNQLKFPWTAAWLANRGLDPDRDLKPKIEPARARLLGQYAVFCVAHELGHATGAWHHGTPGSETECFLGDPQCPMRYWDASGVNYCVPFILGQWDPSKDMLIQSGKPEKEELVFAPYRFCRVCETHGPGFPRLKPLKK